jgi:hypothetical protein
MGYDRPRLDRPMRRHELGGVLTVESVTLGIVSVRISVLELSSGKQVTLSVFRQIKKEELIAGDGSFRGSPWLTINYHPDGCAGGDEHLHVLWIKDQELRRANVYKPTPHRVWYSSTALLMALSEVERRPGKLHMQWPRWCHVQGRRLAFQIEADGAKVECACDVPDSFYSPSFPSPEEVAAYGPLDRNEVYRTLETEVRGELATQAKFQAAGAMLLELEQAFIAA